EFERTLVYDPAHNKAMRKLSEFYQQTGLDQLANELLIKEALYSPLNPEIIEILKEKNLYEQLNPSNGSSQEEVSEDVTTEVEIETEVHADDSGVQSMEEFVESAPEMDAPIEEHSEVATEMSAEEAGPIDNLDPLAGEMMEDENETVDEDISNSVETHETFDASEDIQEEEDFSPLMEGYFEKEESDEADDEQWMEVENLLNGEEDMAEPDVDPVPDGPKDETEMLLEKLSHDDDINLEAAVADPYDQIDLTDDDNKSEIDINDLDDVDLQAAVNDPYEKSDSSEDVIAEEVEQETVVDEEKEEESKTISEIVSDVEAEEKTFIEQESGPSPEPETIDNDIKPEPKVIAQDEIETEPIAQIEDSEEVETISEEDSTQDIQTDEEDASGDTDDEVTINDMLENPNLVTPTFGEILIAQHKFSEARHVFVELSKKEPDNAKFMKKIQFLDKFLQAEGPA
ncbi:MAG: hypothetical protein KAR20_11915, partial [Candidatus Heimdallarchaeota archaeon]|nr:hypothetical protein [Candidatus Heimdallarchaeota archaeon]